MRFWQVTTVHFDVCLMWLRFPSLSLDILDIVLQFCVILVVLRLRCFLFCCCFAVFIGFVSFQFCSFHFVYLLDDFVNLDLFLSLIRILSHFFSLFRNFASASVSAHGRQPRSCQATFYIYSNSSWPKRSWLPTVYSCLLPHSRSAFWTEKTRGCGEFLKACFCLRKRCVFKADFNFFLLLIPRRNINALNLTGVLLLA